MSGTFAEFSTLSMRKPVKLTESSAYQLNFSAVVP
jgi:hypothetical protein